MIKVNGIHIKPGKFPNGESYIDIPDELKLINCVEHINVEFKFENDSELWSLQLIKDWLDDTVNKCATITLILRYIPYSRMDRRESSRLFSLKTFAKIINRMNFDNVVVWEPHSDVSIALFDRVQVQNVTAKITENVYDDLIQNGYSEEEISFVFPDAGAAKRYSKQIKKSNIMVCNKERDFNTGRIIKLDLTGADKNKNCKVAIICDDLCARGGTFALCAKAIKEQISSVEKILLVVAHCENTIFDGNVLNGQDVDMVYTTRSILDDNMNHEKFHIYDCN